MKIIDIYEVFGPTDTTEGRWGGNTSYGYYAAEQAARFAASDKGVMGTEGEVKRCKALQLDDGTVHVFINADPIHLSEHLTTKRQIALAKLTPEERKILGVK